MGDCGETLCNHKPCPTAFLALGGLRGPALGRGKMHSWYLCLGARPPNPFLPSWSQADVRDEEALLRACDGVDCVFHVASYGMSGAEKVGRSVPGVTAGSGPGGARLALMPGHSLLLVT